MRGQLFHLRLRAVDKSPELEELSAVADVRNNVEVEGELEALGAAHLTVLGVLVEETGKSGLVVEKQTHDVTVGDGNHLTTAQVERDATARACRTAKRSAP